MPNSPLRKYPYPSLSDSAIVPNDLRRLAEAVDADVSTVAGSAISAVTRAAELADLVSGIRSILTIQVDDGGATATITYTNGTSERITLPRGPAGEAAGPFVDLIDNGDGTATVVLYDGSTRTLTLPEGAPGAPGKPGDPGPANTLSIGTVTAGDSASATIRGTAPNQVLDLVLPRGEKGDSGGAQKTEWRAVGHLTSSTKNTEDTVRIRRVDDEVQIILDGVGPDSIGEGMYEVTLPSFSGFSPQFVGWSHPVDRGFRVGGVSIETDRTFHFIGEGATPFSGRVVFPTSDPWPTTLPGNPA